MCPLTDASQQRGMPLLQTARIVQQVSTGIIQSEKVKVKSLSRVRLFATPWTLAHQTPLSMGFFQARVLEWVAISYSRSIRPGAHFLQQIICNAPFITLK